ncbi:MAG: response regulator [Deltaproteobacteria bacterium]|nr:response regulator [Deltaproteobacteria bacterium]
MKTVLVVDDDERLLVMYRRAFDKLGKVLVAATPADAIALAKHEPVHIAVVDLHLGRASSISLLRELRALHPNAKIAVISGYLTTDSTVIAMQAGATLVLDKPMAPREILKRLEGAPRADIPQDETPTLADALDAHIARVYADCDGNVSETARRLGIYRSSLQRRLKRHSIKRVP